MNIIAKMADLLDNQGLDSFSLAESRIFELPFVGVGQGVEAERFVPIVWWFLKLFVKIFPPKIPKKYDIVLVSVL